ncbi:MAG: DUF6245 family protein [Actinomycetota bacterium]
MPAPTPLFHDTPPTPRQLVDAMKALGLWTGTGSDGELAEEVARLGDETLYAARLANALQGGVQFNVILAEQAAVAAGATPDQMDAARREAQRTAATSDGLALAQFLRWQVLRAGLVVQQVNQHDAGPIWLAAAHAAEATQLLLGVCGIAGPADPQKESVLEDLDAATDALDNARTNIDILHKLAADTLDGLGLLAPAPEGHPDVEAPAPPDEAAPRPDFTAKQVAMLVERFNTTLAEVTEIVDMLNQYAEAGGRDYETYERILDHLARQGTNLTHAGRAALEPDVHDRATAAIAQAAGTSVGRRGVREAVHERVAMAVLSMIWLGGRHHLIGSSEWPDELPAVVLGVVRRARRINDDR